jgi:large subunit ribosomal protein L32
MAVPRNRNSNARKNSKRSHHAKSVKHTTVCSNCNTARLPHCACNNCGAYHNRAPAAKES